MQQVKIGFFMTPKNLIFIVSDEHSRRYSGCYGDEIVKTPHLDRLAENGTRFSRAYTPSPICVSARASLATGQWVHQTECFSSVEAYDGTIPSWGHHLIDTGHEVVSFGKIGYKEAGPGNGFSREYLPIHNMNGIGWLRGLLRNPLIIPQDNIEITEFAKHIGVGETDYTKYDRVVCDTACSWMRSRARSQEQPWVMFVSFISPHYPLICPREFYDLYDDKSIGQPHRPEEEYHHPILKEVTSFFNYRDYIDSPLALQARRAYYGLCSFTDYLIGNLMHTLEDQNLCDETRIIYTSDHGEMLGNHGMWTKMMMYEDSVGIPMIMSGPDVPQGKVVDTPVSLVDCYPTIIESVGETLTEEEKNLPGTSLFDLTNEEQTDRPIISEYHDGGVSTGLFMLVKGRWKYNYYPGYQPQLFDLINDPQEDKDLAEEPQYQAVLADCDAELRKILDPDAVNTRAFEKQAQIIESFGGYETVDSMEQADIFIEVDALYVNSEELRSPFKTLVAEPDHDRN